MDRRTAARREKGNVPGCSAAWRCNEGEGKGGNARNTAGEEDAGARECKSEMETGSARRGGRDTGGGSGGRRSER